MTNHINDDIERCIVCGDQFIHGEQYDEVEDGYTCSKYCQWKYVVELEYED